MRYSRLATVIRCLHVSRPGSNDRDDRFPQNCRRKRTGTSQSVKRLLYQGGDDGDDSFGLIGWVFDPIFHLLRDKGFGMHVGSFFQ